MPSPTATSTETSAPSSASSPAPGVWEMIVPAATLGSTLLSEPGARRSLACVSAVSASNAEVLPTRSGTATLLGESMRSRTTAAATSGMSGASHHGSHGFCRKTAWLGASGPVTMGGAAPGVRRLRRSSWTGRTPPPRSWGARSCGWRNWIPCGPTFRLGSIICGLESDGFWTPGRLGSVKPPASLAPVSAARSASAASPARALTSRRRSWGRPIQICPGGFAVSVVLFVSPGWSSSPRGSKAKRQSPSASAASKASRVGAFARLRAETV